MAKPVSASVVSACGLGRVALQSARPYRPSFDHRTGARPISSGAAYGYAVKSEDMVPKAESPLPGLALGLSPVSQDDGYSSAYVALGSNLGDRLENIENACRLVDKLPGTRITRTSCMYETKPMYYANQGSFLNAVCEVATTLGPLELLDALQGVEKELKRTKIVDKGPRTIDLDILLYDDVFLEHERLNIPHKLMLEREFVLRPLCE